MQTLKNDYEQVLKRGLKSSLFYFVYHINNIKNK